MISDDVIFSLLIVWYPLFNDVFGQHLRMNIPIPIPIIIKPIINIIAIMIILLSFDAIFIIVDNSFIAFGTNGHTPGTHIGQHSPSSIIVISPSKHCNTSHIILEQSRCDIHFGQHSPGGVEIVSLIPQFNAGHPTKKQSGLQYGFVISFGLHDLNVHIASPSSLHPHVLQPSK